MPGVPPCPFVRAVWDGLIALGLLHAVGQSGVTPPPRERGGFSLCRVGVATDQPGP